jgi:hypothetical protein
MPTDDYSTWGRGNLIDEVRRLTGEVEEKTGMVRYLNKKVAILEAGTRALTKEIEKYEDLEDGDYTPDPDAGPYGP